MPKRTHKDICDLHAISRDQLNYAKSKGVNIYSDAEMMAHLKGRGGQGVTGIDKQAREKEILQGKAQTLEEIEHEVRSATDRATAQLATEKLKGLKSVTEIRVKNGELIPRGKAREDVMRCCAATKGEFMKLANDYAGKLAGLPEAKIHKELRTAVIAILDGLSKEAEKLFPAHE
jgi:hypothetical protein